MNESMESKVLSRIEEAELGLTKSEEPPHILRANQEKEEK